MSLPDDWELPKWIVDTNLPHHWHNYTTEDLRDSWGCFNVSQKKIIATCLEKIASEEDWD